MRPYKKFFLSLEALLYIACKGRGANPISGKEICASQNLKPRHLEPILQILVKAGLLRGVRGPQGGYILLPERRKLTIDQLFTILSSSSDADEAASPLHEKVIKPLRGEMEASIIGQLQGITLEDLCEQVLAHGITEVFPDSSDDYNI